MAGLSRYKVPFIKPRFPSPENILGDYEKILESNWFTNFGPYEQKFSKKSGEYISDKMLATSIANCTLGIEAAIANLFDKEDTYVIMPSFTFAAGANTVLRMGFVPIFIDVELDTWQPKIDQAEKLLSNNLKVAGILLCNTFGVGNPAINKWEQLASKYRMPLIIDSAAGFGSKYDGKEKLGSRGDCEIFSLHATKPFSVGEGGLVSSSNPTLIERVRSWQNFGFDKDRSIYQSGTNAKMQELNAAIGVRQLEVIDEIVTKRRKVLAKYKNILSPYGFSFQINDEYSTVAFASVLAPTSKIADDVLGRLDEEGVEVRKYYKPLHFEKLLQQYVNEDVPLENTENIYSRILSLPVHDDMSLATIKRITSIVIDSGI